MIIKICFLQTFMLTISDSYNWS